MRTLTFAATAVLCLATAACTTEPVKMRNPQTGEVASCGPYYIDGAFSDAQAQREARCISDFQRQGYQRVAE